VDVPGKGDKISMTYVIAEPCVNVKDGACVDVCPVDCIHPTKDEPDYDQHNQLYINPQECIDCGACEPACPVAAIFEESAVPERWRQYLKINADYY
jgi:NAD-dependent dihydropyrimidine dehydrogenase PreA subunit